MLLTLWYGHVFFLAVPIPAPTISPMGSYKKKKSMPPSQVMMLPPPPPNGGRHTLTS